MHKLAKHSGCFFVCSEKAELLSSALQALHNHFYYEKKRFLLGHKTFMQM